MGGLGHIAVLYARAMGCDVVVFSGSEKKKADALELGASEFRVLRPDDQSNSSTPANIDVMLICGGVVSDLTPYVPSSIK